MLKFICKNYTITYVTKLCALIFPLKQNQWIGSEQTSVLRISLLVVKTR